VRPTVHRFREAADRQRPAARSHNRVSRKGSRGRAGEVLVTETGFSWLRDVLRGIIRSPSPRHLKQCGGGPSECRPAVTMRVALALLAAREFSGSGRPVLGAAAKGFLARRLEAPEQTRRSQEWRQALRRYVPLTGGVQRASDDRVAVWSVHP